MYSLKLIAIVCARGRDMSKSGKLFVESWRGQAETKSLPGTFHPVAAFVNSKKLCGDAAMQVDGRKATVEAREDEAQQLRMQ